MLFRSPTPDPKTFDEAYQNAQFLLSQWKDEKAVAEEASREAGSIAYWARRDKIAGLRLGQPRCSGEANSSQGMILIHAIGTCTR